MKFPISLLLISFLCFFTANGQSNWDLLIQSIEPTCDFDHPFRVLSRMTGRVLSAGNDYFILSNYLSDQSSAIPNSDLWISCTLNSSSYLRNYAIDVFFVDPLSNIAVLDTNDLVPGYTLITFANQTALFNMNDDLAYAPIDPNDVYTHWNLAPTDVPANYTGQYNISNFICPEANTGMRFITRMTGQALWVTQSLDIVLNFIIDNSINSDDPQIEGSDIWMACRYLGLPILKNVATGKYLVWDSVDGLYVSDQIATVAQLDDSNTFLGFDFIRIACSSTCDTPYSLSYDNNVLSVGDYNAYDLYSQWSVSYVDV